MSFRGRSALLLFNGGKSVYGVWPPLGTLALVLVSGASVPGIAVASSGDTATVTWTGEATCLAIS